jgi:hypothetical protein
MLPKVLAHQAGGFTFFVSIQVYLVLFFVFASNLPGVLAGQLFSDGLLIINSPSANSPGHAGSTLPISVDISGNGQLSSDAANPSSKLPSHFNSVEIYLVSSQTKLNVTVSTGPRFLTNENGTVRHLSWPVPTCISPGQYNLTFYEASKINGDSRFIITPVAIPIENPRPSGQCSEGVNALQAQPQASNPPVQRPFGGVSGSPTLVTITLDGSQFDFPTVTKTIAPTVPPSTVVVVSMQTVTTTASGRDGMITSVYTQTFTTTAIVQSDNSGFMPVNAALPLRAPAWTFLLGICIIGLF